jgi:hypothetical protein
MLRQGQTDEKQVQMVQNVLKNMMTPVLPPLYRTILSGDWKWNGKGMRKFIKNDIIGRSSSSSNGMNNDVDEDDDDDGEDDAVVFRDAKSEGPLFYAPFLTSVVTTLLFPFLLGPSKINYRKDGKAGGLVIEKCKFLQESNCKSICVNQCKMPTQRFFKDELLMDLNVIPNFETQECQWSFGEKAYANAKDDPSLPKGCLVGCDSRKALSAEARRQRKNMPAWPDEEFDNGAGDSNY